MQRKPKWLAALTLYTLAAQPVLASAPYPLTQSVLERSDALQSRVPECSDFDVRVASNCELGALGQSDCACEVPMSGHAGSPFRELDIIVRQFVKYRDVGGAALAVSLDGRRVYKRGFGRMDGDHDDVTQPVVPADAPMAIGSVSKNLVAAVARRLIDERLKATGQDAQYPSAGDVPLLHSFVVEPGVGVCGPAQDECLLPNTLRNLFAGNVDVPVYVDTHDDLSQVEDWDFLDGDDEQFPNEYDCRRAGAMRADKSWRTVTVGDLLGHSAGLPRSAPDPVKYILSNVMRLRNYVDVLDLEAEENAIVAANAALAGPLAAARAVIEPALGLAAGQSFHFVNLWAVPNGQTPSDEILRVLAGRCLAYEPAGNTDSNPITSWWSTDNPDRPFVSYSNTMGAVLERIVEHLDPSGRFTAPTGSPELESNSALRRFLKEELGLKVGVESAHGIYHWQRVLLPGYQPYHPVPRHYKLMDGALAAFPYYPMASSLSRPFCVLAPGWSECGTQQWKSFDGSPEGEANLRYGWNFAADAAGEALAVPFWTSGYSLGAGPGALLAEMPALVAFASRYAVSGAGQGDKGIQKGRERATCGTQCEDTMAHNGSLGGGKAWVASLTKKTVDKTLPPLDGHGRLHPDFEALAAADETRYESLSIAEKGGVDFAFAINQDNDVNCYAEGVQPDEDADPDAEQPDCKGYTYVSDMIRYALSRVDWRAVEHEVATQRDRLAGMTMVDETHATYFYEDEMVRVQLDTPEKHLFTPEQSFFELPFELPSTRIAPDIVGVAQGPDEMTIAWYDDGRISIGESWDLDTVYAPTPESFYKIAPGLRYRDVAEVAIGGQQLTPSEPAQTITIAWYTDEDRTYSWGSMLDLASGGTGNYELPPGQTAQDIVGIAMGTSLNEVRVKYRDGAVSVGTPDKLDAFDYVPGPVAGLSIDSSFVHVHYKSGYMRTLTGALWQNWPLSTNLNVFSEGYYRLPDGVRAADVLEAFAKIGSQQPGVWLRDGKVALGSKASDASASTAMPPAPPPGQVSWANLAGADRGGNFGLLTTWWKDGNYYVHDTPANNFAVLSAGVYTTAAAQAPANVRAVAYDPRTGSYWALYADGSISRGTRDKLDQAYWGI
jgi:hypothetical protein